MYNMVTAVKLPAEVGDQNGSMLRALETWKKAQDEGVHLT